MTTAEQQLARRLLRLRSVASGGCSAAAATAAREQRLLHSSSGSGGLAAAFTASRAVARPRQWWTAASSRHAYATAAAAPEADSGHLQQLGPVFRQTCRVAGQQWTFETGRLAGLAHGACVATVGGTSVLSTAVVAPEPQLEADGVPLQVEYRERFSAAGRLPARPDRRERTGTEREVLAGRLIDRALRPLLPPGFLYDTQVWCQVLSVDGATDPEVVALNAASAALLLAPNVPYSHPIGAVKLFRSDPAAKHQFAAPGSSAAGAPATTTTSSSGSVPYLTLAYAGSPSKATAIEATARQASDTAFVQAMRLAAWSTAPLIQAQQALASAAAAAQEQQQRRPLALLWPSQACRQAVASLAREPLLQLFSSGHAISSSSSNRNKAARAADLTGLQQQLLADMQRLGQLAEDGSQLQQQQQGELPAGMFARADVLRAFDLLQSEVMREVLLRGQADAGSAAAAVSTRVDGRGPTELRLFAADAGVLPRAVHGSGVFTRGETQSLATATVGHDTDVPLAESLFSRRVANRLHLHYNFPPFCVGEVGKPAGGPNRREVGHANLARAGLIGLLPREDDWPFTVRVTADTLSSSGSSSMAAVCAGSLALAAAGVPMQALAAGISVGLVTERPPQLADAGAPGCDAAAYSRHVAAAQAGRQQHAVQAAAGDGSGGSSSGSESDAQENASEPAAAATGSDEGSSVASSEQQQQALSSSYGPALLLTDIQGIEDHLGDMDFKVAGTARGITAVQLDTKLPGVDLHLLEAALAPAAAARSQLLGAMQAAVDAYEAGTPAIDQPQSGSVTLLKELVPRLIGPQGSTLLDIEEGCGASLIVDDGGTVSVYAPTQMRFQHALAAVQEVEGGGVEAGQVYRVRVMKVVDFGAYVALPNGLPALLHISELSHEKIREVRDVLAEDQELDVVCTGRDAKGFVRLSRKALLPAPAAAEAAGEGGGGEAAEGGGGSAGAGAGAADGGGRPSQHQGARRGASSSGSSSSSGKQQRAQVWRRGEQDADRREQ